MSRAEEQQLEAEADAYQAQADYERSAEGQLAKARADLAEAVEACEAMAAWHWAEANHKLTTFHERMELCKYSEWLGLRVLVRASGRNPDSAEYAGLLDLWSGHRTTSPEVRAIVERILANVRAAIAKAKGEA